MWLHTAASNAAHFTDSLAGDIAFRAVDGSAKLLLGCGSDGTAALVVGRSNVAVSGRLAAGGGLLFGSGDARYELAVSGGRPVLNSVAPSGAATSAFLDFGALAEAAPLVPATAVRVVSAGAAQIDFSWAVRAGLTGVRVRFQAGDARIEYVAGSVSGTASVAAMPGTGYEVYAFAEDAGISSGWVRQVAVARTPGQAAQNANAPAVGAGTVVSAVALSPGTARIEWVGVEPPVGSTAVLRTLRFVFSNGDDRLVLNAPLTRDGTAVVTGLTHDARHLIYAYADDDAAPPNRSALVLQTVYVTTPALDSTPPSVGAATVYAAGATSPSSAAFRWRGVTDAGAGLARVRFAFMEAVDAASCNPGTVPRTVSLFPPSPLGPTGAQTLAGLPYGNGPYQITGSRARTNETFNDNTRGWTLEAGTTTISGGKLNVTAGGNFLALAGGLTNGETYTYSIDYVRMSANAGRLGLGSVSGLSSTNIHELSTSGTLTGTFTASATTFYLEARDNHFWGTIDNIVLTANAGATVGVLSGADDSADGWVAVPNAYSEDAAWSITLLLPSAVDVSAYVLRGLYGADAGSSPDTFSLDLYDSHEEAVPFASDGRVSAVSAAQWAAAPLAGLRFDLPGVAKGVRKAVLRVSRQCSDAAESVGLSRFKLLGVGSLTYGTGYDTAPAGSGDGAVGGLPSGARLTLWAYADDDATPRNDSGWVRQTVAVDTPALKPYAPSVTPATVGSATPVSDSEVQFTWSGVEAVTGRELQALRFRFSTDTSETFTFVAEPPDESGTARLLLAPNREYSVSAYAEDDRGDGSGWILQNVRYGVQIWAPAGASIDIDSGSYVIASAVVRPGGDSRVSVLLDAGLSATTSAASGEAYLMLYDADDAAAGVPPGASAALRALQGGASNVRGPLV
jgi:hypothetical protein